MAARSSKADADKKPEADRLEGFPHPRESSVLFGHEKAFGLFSEAWRNNRLHHAWLLSGQNGVGKATLAYHLAKLVLAREQQEGGKNNKKLQEPSWTSVPKGIDAELVRNDSHPNLFVLRRSWNSKTKKISGRISVDDIRRLHPFLGNTAGMGLWRVVIVDRADELNPNAANALLKMLEEPPGHCLFMLVSSEPGRLATTIRSRCRKLRLATLQKEELLAAVRHVAGQAVVELPEDKQLQIIGKLAQGSVRKALEFVNGRTLKDHRDIEAILDLLPRVDPDKTIALAERLSARSSDNDYHGFLHLLFSLMAKRIRQMALEGRADSLCVAQWASLWETFISKKNEVDLLNLDRGNFIIDLFARMEEVADKAGGLTIR